MQLRLQIAFQIRFAGDRGSPSGSRLPVGAAASRSDESTNSHDTVALTPWPGGRRASVRCSASAGGRLRETRIRVTTRPGSAARARAPLPSGPLDVRIADPKRPRIPRDPSPLRQIASGAAVWSDPHASGLDRSRAASSNSPHGVVERALPVFTRLPRRRPYLAD